MILAAMLIALGGFLSGLIWLALTVALVRRARRLTERRLLATVATRRAEFDAERDEMRARHAVELHRQEREVGRVLDLATAYRLESEVKDLDLAALKAEFAAREEEISETIARLGIQRELVQELERRHAEAGSALRATQHSLKLERRRRAAAEEALGEAEAADEERRVELAALRAENAALRLAAGDLAPPEWLGATASAEGGEPPRLPSAPAILPDAIPEPEPLGAGGSVVPLRPRPAETGAPPEILVAQATRKLQRLAGEANGEIGRAFWRASAGENGRRPRPPEESEAVVTALDVRRAAALAESESELERDEAARARFYEALSEIGTAKRPAIQAGE